jgi:imidazolonepropionase-like amidohydrolase
MLRRSLVAPLAFLLAVPAASSAQNAPVVFTGVSVIPMDQQTVLANQTVIVENGRITHVGAQRAAPARAASS